MTRVLAAIDNSAAARPVLVVASALAQLLGADVNAVHVQQSDMSTAQAEADSFALPLRVLRGPVAEARDALTESDDDVSVLVVGTRGLPGPHDPVGHVTTQLIATVTKPVIAVPPELTAWFGLQRVLVPVDDASAIGEALPAVIEFAVGHGLEIVVLHVFDASTLPMFGDQPQHEVPAWAAEFLGRFCPDEPERVRCELRVGFPAEQVLEVLDSLDADLVFLEWSRDLAPGHAEVVQRALARATVPLVLIPVPVGAGNAIRSLGA